MPKLDLSAVPEKTGSIYPAPYDAQMEGRTSLRLGQAGGLKQFGVNIVTLAPGAVSSLRHWHLKEDEFVMVTEGTCHLIEEDGATEMTVGDCAAFPANTPNGHCFENRSDAVARFLVVGSKMPGEEATYSDVDLKVRVTETGTVFTHWDGTPYGTRPAEDLPAEDLPADSFPADDSPVEPPRD